MQEEMEASSMDSNETTVKWQASKEERIATWHFVMLDKNKNKVLDKRQLSLIVLPSCSINGDIV